MLAVAGCGSSPVSPSSSSSSSSSSRTAGAVSARSVERALLAHGGPPAPSAVSCRAATAAERAAAPFGQTRLPVFTCALTVGGVRATYLVEVLANGCFVAERRPAGRAIYGCGVGRS